MDDTIRAFATGLIDYAGLFPPARLGMADACREYAGHRRADRAWMLGRFVVPASRLPELAAEVENVAGDGDPALALTVLTGGGESDDSALEEMREGLARTADFVRDHGGRVVVEVVETRLPTSLAGSDDVVALRAFLESCAAAAAAAGMTAVDLYFEGAPGAGAHGADVAVAEALAATHCAVMRGRTGYKLRCGGEEPTAYPPVRRVAEVLLNCRDLEVPLKLTAGLHHAVRRLVKRDGATHHGFLNVLGAGILAMARHAGQDVVEACVAEGEPSAFALDAEGFRWRDVLASPAEVRDARRRLVTGFGSCSFDEPVDDLRSLGMLR